MIRVLIVDVLVRRAASVRYAAPYTDKDVIRDEMDELDQCVDVDGLGHVIIGGASNGITAMRLYNGLA